MTGARATGGWSAGRRCGRLALLAVAGGLAGCSPPATPPATAPAAEVETPKQVLQRLIALRSARDYRRLPDLTAAGSGPAIVETLLAVDDFLAANGRLCDWVRDHIGLGLSQTVDQSYLGDDLGTYLGPGLGIFSREAELLDETISGGTARVTYLVAHRLPVREVRLQRSAGGWRLDPGGVPSPLLAEAFHDMARGLDRVLAELRSGSLPADAVRDDPQRLIEKVRARLRRGVALLSKARAAEAAAE